MVLPWLVGCSWNGSAIQPDPGIPAQWPEAERIRMESDAEAGFRPMPWRELYADPQLRTLIEAALETSRDLRAATARMEKAAALLGVAGAARVPTLQVEAGHLAARTPGDLSSSGQATISHREDAGLSLPAFEIDLRGRLAHLEEGARAGYLASGEAAHAARVVLIAQVAETFVLWREMEERSQLARTALETQQQARALVGQRVGAGVAQAQSGLKAAMVLEGMRADLAE